MIIVTDKPVNGVSFFDCNRKGRIPAVRGSALFCCAFRLMLLRELYLSGSIQRPAEIIRAMREAHHAGLVSGRGEEDALGAHLAVELFEKILIALLHFREIGHRHRNKA